MLLIPLLFIFFLTWFTEDADSGGAKTVHQHLPDKVLSRLKGSTVVLSPDLVEAQVNSIRWKYGDGVIADWYGQRVPFYRSFKDRCSLNTKTGELIINYVGLEQSGVYTPEINSRTLAAVKLQVFSPVPKPSITMSCNSEQTQCTLTCTFNRTEDLGNVEVFWILDSRREKGGSELNITKETKEKTFICSLNNSVSSENSNKLQNPFLAGHSKRERRWFWIALSLFEAVLLLLFHRYKIQKIIDRFSKKRNPSTDGEKTLRNDESQVFDETIVEFFNGRNGTQRDEESDLMLQNVHKMIERFFKERKGKRAIKDIMGSLLNEQTRLTSVETEVCNHTPNVIVEIHSDPNGNEPAENPDLSSSSVSLI
ncbi:hypothetical protein OJAV_G00012850 [Oryzias javanicus]|uniref:Ig-like domain-containing protein n=1 Tax=Oryzias javanicus TaxID=123683 RepID=A0A437DJ38_ORYJA|nr:hypothetical protein OJAV_G00012850 [Oryzias javanicus]